MRPVERIREELIEAGLTVMAAGSDGQEGADLELEAGEAIRRSYDALGSDEQEAVRLDLAVPEDASHDEIGLAVLADVRRRRGEASGRS